MNDMLDTALSLMALAILALTLGAVYLLRRGGAKKQAVLMLVLAGVLAANVAIWTVPDGQGHVPAVVGR